MGIAGLTFAFVIGSVIVIAVATGAFYTARYRRTQRLRERFGPEYDHAMAVAGDRRRAEAALRKRGDRGRT